MSHPSPAAVSNVGSICWSGWSTVADGTAAPWFYDWLLRFAGFSASSHLGLSSERRADGTAVRPAIGIEEAFRRYTITVYVRISAASGQRFGVQPASWR